MKGLILAGGRATRLRPLTHVTNKHLLPIYNKPLIYYPLEAMARAGVEDVIITTNPEHAGQFINLLRTGKDWGLKLTFEIQENPVGGLAEPIKLIEPFAKGSKLLMLLGDNIFTHNLKPAVDKFRQLDKGAMTFAKAVEHPEHYGVVQLAGEKVVSIEEKPSKPKTNLAQVGAYMYDERVYALAQQVKPSERGQLEITDLNSLYVDEGTCYGEEMEGYWIDAGTSFDELLAANNTVAELVRKGEL